MGAFLALAAVAVLSVTAAALGVMAKFWWATLTVGVAVWLWALVSEVRFVRTHPSGPVARHRAVPVRVRTR